jgi:hypothetical protein
MDAFFSQGAPILKARPSDALIQHFDQILHWLLQAVAAKKKIPDSHLPLALARLKSGELERCLSLKDALKEAS